jgi:hypothetical protein
LEQVPAETTVVLLAAIPGQNNNHIKTKICRNAPALQDLGGKHDLF